MHEDSPGFTYPQDNMEPSLNRNVPKILISVFLMSEVKPDARYANDR